MRHRGILSRRQRHWAWAGFVMTASQAPLSAHFVSDASWLFSLVVAGMVGVLLAADESARRPTGTRRGLFD
ncbi:MAG TPA: hypothetical protein VGJ53_01760 [Micromonosporaceae bacterium]|jgi:hypothetical protein